MRRDEAVLVFEEVITTDDAVNTDMEIDGEPVSVTDGVIEAEGVGELVTSEVTFDSGVADTVGDEIVVTDPEVETVTVGVIESLGDDVVVTVPDVETVDGDNVITKVDVGEGEIVSVNDSEVKGLDEGEAVVSIDGVFVGVKDGLLDVDGVLEGEIDAHTTPLPEETQGEPPTASRTT